MTLEAKDLMVGDWVQLNGEPMQVSRIDLYSVNAKPAFCCGSPHIWNYNNDFKPIPLTEEILKKNFIVERHNKYIQWSPCENCNTCFAIRIFINSTMIEGLFEYVHELQHALKLCKIEKQIEL